jgi:hypothetical protein
LKKTIILILAAAALTVFAEDITITATNTMKFGSGSEWAGDKKDIEIKKQYFEDWLDLQAVKGDFTAGIRFEAADSSSHNERISEITRMFFNYTKDKISITAGDFYGSFGRGLVFGLKESKADFFDSKVRGGKFEYCGELFGLKALGGKSYFKYINDFDPLYQTVEEMDNAILGSELILPVGRYLNYDDLTLNLSGSYLFIKGDEVPVNQYLHSDMFIEKTDIFGFGLEVSAFDAELYNEYAVKITDRTPSQTGWANYTSLSYAVKGISLGLEFKDYYKYGANPNEAASGFTPYQNAPELVIAHSSHLLNTHPHEVNPNDEIGYKFTWEYQMNDNTAFKGSFASASKHNGDSIIPEMDDTYLPYSDSWLGADMDIDIHRFSAGLGYMKDSPISKGVNQLIEPGEDTELEVYSDERLTFMGDYKIKMNETSSISLCGELQKVNNEFLDEDYNDIYGSVEYEYSPYGYVNVSLITTSQKVPDDSPDSWLGFEAGINIKENHKLEIFYGRERSGIKCSGGTCRQVPEFDGLRITLVSDF